MSSLIKHFANNCFLKMTSFGEVLSDSSSLAVLSSFASRPHQWCSRQSSWLTLGRPWWNLQNQGMFFAMLLLAGHGWRHCCTPLISAFLPTLLLWSSSATSTTFVFATTKWTYWMGTCWSLWPIKTSEKGKRFILCMTDIFTKYIKLVLLDNKESGRTVLTMDLLFWCAFGSCFLTRHWILRKDQQWPFQMAWNVTPQNIVTPPQMQQPR